MIEYKIDPQISDDDLNDLFTSTWENHVPRKFGPILEHSLTYICAVDNSKLVGFVNVAWDGGIHGFILDTTVHGSYQHRRIGTEMMELAAKVAADRGLEWLHVDYDLHLDSFYKGCGYRHTEAGLLNLKDKTD